MLDLPPILTRDNFEMKRLAEDLAPVVARGNHEEIQRALSALAGRLPTGVRDALSGLPTPGAAGIALGGLGLLVDDLPRTPTAAPDTLAGQAAHAVATQLLYASALGSVYTYERMKQSGRLFQHVFPVPGLERSQTAASSSEALDWHSEHADKVIPPDWLAILCLRNPTRTCTRLSRPSLAGIAPAAREALADPAGFEADTNEAGFAPVSRAGELRYDPLHTAPRTPAAAKAWAALQAEVERAAVRAVQVPGQILLIPNRLTVHAREAFAAHFNGQDRWLVRCFVADPGRALPGWKI